MASREIDGRTISVTNLDKVLYPRTGTTKGEVIDYYVEIAPAMLAHVAGRPITRKRWPSGTDRDAFFEKNLAASTPSWIDRRRIAHSGRDVVYPLFHTPAEFAWLGQQAALEAHVPQWRFDGDEPGLSTRLMFDLDPGDDVDLDRCADIACRVRDLIADTGLTAYPVTSGSKGIHLYVPLATELSAAGASTVAKQVATLLERQYPNDVTASMAKADRPGKVFLDWSQNSANKTTIAPYSLRGRALPTVAAPRTWDEIEAGGLTQLQFDEVLRRFRSGGDLLAELDPQVPVSPPVDRLGEYRGKRSAAKTPEPVPVTNSGAHRSSPKEPVFVIQEHHASRLHYDFRLEHDGVLVSWAIPKNLSTDTAENRLAVHTEDHPLDYADFEGSIPHGEYGGGEVSVWDRGTYRLEKWRDDEVIVVLAGERITGRYALIRTGGKQWLAHRTKTQPSTATIPTSIRPMLATAGTLDEPTGSEWIYEGKWDGVRVIVTVSGGDVTIVSRTGQDLTARYAGISALAADLGGHEVVLDGEAVVEVAGVTDFGALQDARPADVGFFAFDLLHLDGVDLTSKKYSDRRQLLELLAAGDNLLTVPDLLDGPAEHALAESVRRGWEGVVAKRVDSSYEVGRRSKSWIKVKNWRTQEVVIGGWRAGKGGRSASFGSLLLGIPTSDGLRYVGRVGTGFTERQLLDIRGTLSPLVVADSPFGSTVPAADRRDATWVEPRLVAEVQFFEWTDSGSLRHPSWRGLRTDKSPVDVVREHGEFK